MGTSALSVGGSTGLSTPSNGAVFNFNLSGSSNSSIVITNALSFGASGTDTINISGTPTATQYTLMTFSSQTGTPAFSLGTTPGGAYSYTLSDTGTTELLTVNAASNSLIWDASGSAGTAAGETDGSGNWVNGSTNFVYSTNGQAAWSNSTFYNVTFGNNKGSAGTVTLTGPITVSGLLTFQPTTSGSYTIAASAGNALTLAGGITANASAILSGPIVLGASQSWTTSGSDTLSVSGNLSESTAGTGLVLTGSGNVALGGNNTYSGGTSLTGGTLEVGASTVIASGAISTGPVGTGMLTLGTGTTLEDDGTPRTLANALSLSGTITFASAGGLTFDPTGLTTPTVATLTADTTLTVNNTTTINESIGGGYNLAVNGSGTLVLGGNDTYTGSTTISSGALEISSGGGLGTSSGLVLGGGTLDADGNITYAGSVSGTGDIYVAGGDTLTLSGTVDATITATGPGILDITNNTGTTNVQAGTYNTTPTGAGNITISSGGIVNFTTGGTDSGNITVSSGSTGYVNATGGTVTLSGTLTKAGSNLLVGGNSLVVISGQITGGSPGTFNSDMSFTTNTQLTNGNNDYLGNSYIYEGATVSSGVLNAMPISTILNLGNGDSSSGAFDLASYSQTLAGLQTAGGTADTVTNSSGTAAILTIDNVTGNPSSGMLSPDTYSGQLAGNLSLVKTGNGTFTLSGTSNSYTGSTTVSGGILALGVADALPTGTTLTVNSTGTFDLADFSQTLSGLSDGGVTTGTITDSGTAATFTINSSAANTFSGTIGGEYLALAMQGAGTLYLGGSNSYGGGTSINTGTVSVSADNNLGATSGAVTFTGGGTLAVTTGYTSQHNFAFGSGGGNIDVTGGQTFTASGTWTSTGGGVTLTGGGTVELNPGSYGSADNPLSVTAANGSLTGTATVLGSITIGSGGTVSPGTSTSSPGTLTFSTGTSTLDAGGTLDFNLTSAGTSSSNTSIGSAGTSWNLLAVNTLAASGLSSSARFDVTATSSLPGNFNPASSYQWDIITAAGGLPGGLTSQDFSLNTAALGVEPGSFSIAVGTMTGGVGYVAIDYSPSAVPEPGSMLLAGLAALGLAGLGWRRRRRQRGQPEIHGDRGSASA